MTISRAVAVTTKPIGPSVSRHHPKGEQTRRFISTSTPHPELADDERHQWRPVVRFHGGGPVELARSIDRVRRFF